jgi:hypothetical protein
MTVKSWDDEVEVLREELDALRSELNFALTPPAALEVPSVTEFVLSEHWLAQQRLYPRQATLLKTVFLEAESFTPFDDMVVDQWCAGFVQGHADGVDDGWWWEPSGREPDVKGTTPDLRDRMALHRSLGRKWFPHLHIVGGRRGGKGHLAALTVVRALARLLALDEPQPYVHADRGKTLTVDIFAGNQGQARENVFADVVRVICASPFFLPYIVEVRRDRMTLATPYDLRTHGPGFGTIEIIARETTTLAGRGQTSVIQVYDEMAFVTPGTSKAPAEELFGAATPALDQAGDLALIITISSPYQRIGKFYALNRQAHEINVATGTALYPEIVPFQFASWDLYQDWERAATLPLVNPAFGEDRAWFRCADGSTRTFPDAGGPVSAYDERMRQAERSDPDRFRVERRAQWADVTNPYLNAAWIEGMWRTPDGEEVRRLEAGVLADTFYMHIDPSSKHDPYGLAIGRRCTDGSSEWAEIVHMRRWLAAAGRQDLDAIDAEIVELVRRFNPEQITVDQHGGEFLVSHLKNLLSDVPSPKRRNIWNRPHTSKLDGRTTELFRSFMQAGMVRSYFDRQLDLELRFLQYQGMKVAAPTTGFVTTDDVADAVIVVAVELLDPASSTVKRDFEDVPLRARSSLNPTDPMAQAFTDAGRRRDPSTRPGVGRTIPLAWNTRGRRRPR